MLSFQAHLWLFNKGEKQTLGKYSRRVLKQVLIIKDNQGEKIYRPPLKYVQQRGLDNRDNNILMACQYDCFGTNRLLLTRPVQERKKILSQTILSTKFGILIESRIS